MKPKMHVALVGKGLDVAVMGIELPPFTASD
jgi:hypothetical protein